jgi:hypothetical protein
MKIIRGRDKGIEVPIGQWCNNWITSKLGRVYGLLSVELDPSEMLMILRHKNNGYMFGVYTLEANGRFKKIRRSHGKGQHKRIEEEEEGRQKDEKLAAGSAQERD